MKARLGTGILASLTRARTTINATNKNTIREESEDDSEYETIGGKKSGKKEKEIWKVLDFDG